MNMSAKPISALIAATFAVYLASAPVQAAVEQPGERIASRSQPLHPVATRPARRQALPAATETRPPWRCNSFLCGGYIVLGIGF